MCHIWESLALVSRVARCLWLLARSQASHMSTFSLKTLSNACCVGGDLSRPVVSAIDSGVSDLLYLAPRRRRHAVQSPLFVVRVILESYP